MLLLISGHYIRRRKLGFVAEFCPRCQQPQPAKFFEVLRYLHYYYIPVPVASFVRHEIQCTRCKWINIVDPERYETHTLAPGNSIDLLIQQTHPRLWDELEERTLLKIRIEDGEASHEERTGLVVETLSAFEPEVAKRASQINIDGRASLSLLAALALPIATAVAAKNSHGNWVGMLCVGQAAFFMLMCAYLLATDVRRYCRRVIVPLTLPALATSHPTVEDLQAALNHLKAMKFKIGFKLRPAELFSDLQSFVKSSAIDR